MTFFVSKIVGKIIFNENDKEPFQGSAMKSGVGSTENSIFFYQLILCSFSMRIRWCKENKLLTVEFAVGIFLKSFFIYLTHIFGEKKSAQISILSTAIDRKTMFPVDWCTQIVFLIFRKIEFLDSDASNATFHRKTLR